MGATTRDAVWVRLVKGAYWDYETVIARREHWPIPVFTQKWQSDACFERCATFLLENERWLRPAIASHNVRSMAHALAVAEHLRLAPGAFEAQMLYGMGDELKQSFVDRGVRLRIYTPFGRLLPGMAYLVRRLLENTSNTSFLRATFTEHASVARLLRAPSAVGREYQETAMNHQADRPENLPAFSNEPLVDFSGGSTASRCKQPCKRCVISSARPMICGSASTSCRAMCAWSHAIRPIITNALAWWPRQLSIMPTGR